MCVRRLMGFGLRERVAATVEVNLRGVVFVEVFRWVADGRPWDVVVKSSITECLVAWRLWH